MTTIKGPSKKAPSGRQVFDELKGLITESINPRTRNIDRLSTRSILKAINREDATVATVVAKEIPYIAMAVEMAIKTFKNKGRLFYVGAGTSGRLGVLDAAECPPTFGTDPKMIKGIIAGGYDSLIRSKEGVEDNIEAAIADIKKNRIKSNDMVIGITASKRTPYVLAALREAKKQKASTVFICCNPRKTVPKGFDLSICPVVGPEALAGSSRMKAGTAQKMILNMITTTTMIRMGRAYGNRMVNLMATSEKLKERSKRVLIDITGCDYETSEKILKSADGSVKIAIVMALTRLSKNQAKKLLISADGFIHKAVKMAKKP